MTDRNMITLLAGAQVIVIALLAGAAAGYLARRDHATYPAALARAAMSFTATVALAATVVTTVAGVGHT
ncbi:hypothetical protein ABII15_33370 [Streptomyces sp. HUAS MG91]|uniref:Integral membrane protein n=1 Tax=Streptomyces tabacisoli TaxID=3156398 RepID=A0AAU8J2W9_9ACTN